MTDRELLEFAAKAAGYTLGSTTLDDDYWNPIHDDGDALRLAVQCTQLFGFYRFLRAWLVAMKTESGDPTDPLAATRRAIVMAAAEIGKAQSAAIAAVEGEGA